MKGDVTVEIDCPIEIVFDCAMNHVAEWSLTVIEDEALVETPEVVGSTFRTVTEDRGRRMEFTGIVTAHTPPTHVAVALTGKSFDLDVEYFLEDLGGRTKIRQVSQCKGKGFVKVLFTLFGWAMKKMARDAGNKEMGSLAAFAEAKAGRAS